MELPLPAPENTYTNDREWARIRRRARMTGPQPVWHCRHCDAIVWQWYGRLYSTREAALAARPARTRP